MKLINLIQFLFLAAGTHSIVQAVVVRQDDVDSISNSTTTALDTAESGSASDFADIAGSATTTASDVSESDSASDFEDPASNATMTSSDMDEEESDSDDVDFDTATNSTSIAEDDEVDDEARRRVHRGDITHYSGGLTACGNNHGPDDFVAAVSFHRFETFPGCAGNPNHCPICKKRARVTWHGKQVTVRIQDKCGACGDGDLDLTNAAFKKLAPLGRGRLHGAKWHYI